MPRKKKTEETSKETIKEHAKKEIKEDKIIVAQPEINIGMIGHVDHGKTTLVQTLSGKWTDTHSEEIKRGITIRLGYADVVFYKCPKCLEPDYYGLQPECIKCKSKAEIIRKISLVDAPGHESLMATMLCGANIMDGALLLVAANEECPQPQTQEHLMALEITGIKNIIVLQNKIDLVTEEQALKNHEQITKFLKGTKFENSPIIPISAFHKINIDILIAKIQELFPTPERDTEKDPLMFVARSFDINKPGTEIDKLAGGVLGGVLKHGRLRKGDQIEIRPGYELEVKNQKVWKPLIAKIEYIITGGETVDEVYPGGSFAIQTTLDPSVIKSDKIVGNVVGHQNKLPKVLNELTMNIQLLDRIVGAKDKLVVDQLKPNELLMLNVYSAATVGIVKEIAKGQVKLILRRPVCAQPGARVTISRSIGQRWRLIGYGELKG